jgi:hypothetical protein
MPGPILWQVQVGRTVLVTMEDGQETGRQTIVRTAVWKRALAFGAGFGVAAVLTVAVIGGCVYWYSTRPKGWDSTLIKCIGASAVQSFELDDAKKEFHGSGFDLKFVLENQTGRDYTVPQDLRLFTKDQKTAALEEFSGKVEHPYVVPARERAMVEVDVEYSCTSVDMVTDKRTDRDPQTCFNEEFGTTESLVGFDDETHTRLNLMKPTFAAPASHKEQGSSAKGRTDPYAAIAKPYPCDDAKKLASACRLKEFRPSPTSGDGWQPMPDFPVAPKSAELVPNKHVCDIAFRWQDFCTWQQKE